MHVRVGRGGRRRALGAAVAVFATVAAVVTPVLFPAPAEAASASNFDPGFIISDETMYAASELNAAEIDAFLDVRGSECRASGGLPCLKDIRIDYPARGNTSFCAAVPAGAGRTAGQAIEAVSLACSINPQVMLVLIEKEQSLVTRTVPTEYSYRYATGYACPDTSGCSDAAAGFFVQLYAAASQFQRYAANPTGYNHLPGRYNDVLFSPNAGCGSSSIFIENQATASLYNYTPYQPNAAALANLYGTGDYCSSYGNRNFWRIFTDWFGSPGNLIDNGSFEYGAASWGFSGAMDRQVVPSASAPAGANVMRANAREAGASLHQTAVRSSSIGNSYEARLSVRAVGADASARVRLVVWALGGTAENTVTSATVGSAWSDLSANTLLRKAGHSSLRIELYVDTPGVLIEIDSGHLIQTETQALGGGVGMSSPSFENGFGRWAPGNGFINRVIYTSEAKAADGASFLAMNTTAQGRSMSQTIHRNVSVSSAYTATVWVRSANSRPFTGNLALWALGQAPQSRSTSFTVTDVWTPVTVTVPISKAGNDQLKLEVYLNTVGATLYVDDVSLSTNLLENPSVESGVPPWQIGQAGTNLVTYPRRSGQYIPVDGGYVGATNVKVVGGSVLLDRDRLVRPGEVFTASIWVRAANASRSADVTLALWGLGGEEPINAVAHGTAGAEWTELVVTLPVGQAGIDRLRLELYQNTVSTTILFDGARLY